MTSSMFSPPRREKARDDSHLPKGDCRYILLHPAVEGLRCACVGFTLNRSIPGSTCDCGHNSCYHEPNKDNGAVDWQEMKALKEKISRLEERLEQQTFANELVERIGRLEESVDKNKGDGDTEMKNMYRNVGGLWHSIGQMQKKSTYYDDRIEGLEDSVQRMQNSLINIDDASMKLEDRVECLERESMPSTHITSRRRKASTPPGPSFEDIEYYPSKLEASDSDSGIPCSVESPCSSRLPLHIATTEEPSHIQDFRQRVSSVGSGSQAWTVHVSLLPTPAQPFPFEKDTAAYKRCLSRGLHRVVAIPDSDHHSFVKAVSDAFSEILRGRSWNPLVAKLCDAKTLRGLPMLRQLDAKLIDSNYNVEFLQENCAVIDESGKILDLYIAMQHDTISWPELKEVSQYMDGLEAAWTFDPYLDGLLDESEGVTPNSGRPAAGDILSTWSPISARPKRKENEITRTASFSSTTETENARAKLRRTRPYPSSNVDSVERRVGAVQ